MDKYFTFICMGIILIMVVSFFLSVLMAQAKFKKATTALGDTTYTLGIPNTPWKQHNISYLEYRMVVQALVRSGDFSPENVQRCLSGIDRNSNGVNYYSRDDISSNPSDPGNHNAVRVSDLDFSTHGSSVRIHDDTDHGSKFGDPFSTDNLSPTNAFLGDALNVIHTDYHHDSDIGKSGSDF